MITRASAHAGCAFADHRELFAARPTAGAHRADESSYVRAVDVADLVERHVGERAVARDRLEVLLEHPLGEIVGDAFEIVEDLA